MSATLDVTLSVAATVLWLAGAYYALRTPVTPKTSQQDAQWWRDTHLCIGFNALALAAGLLRETL